MAAADGRLSTGQVVKGVALDIGVWNLCFAFEYEEECGAGGPGA